MGHAGTVMYITLCSIIRSGIHPFHSTKLIAVFHLAYLAPWMVRAYGMYHFQIGKMAQISLSVMQFPVQVLDAEINLAVMMPVQTAIAVCAMIFIVLNVLTTTQIAAWLENVTL